MACVKEDRRAIFHNVFRILGRISLGTAMMVTYLLILVQRSRTCPSLSSSDKLPNFCLQLSRSWLQRSSKVMTGSASSFSSAIVAPSTTASSDSASSFAILAISSKLSSASFVVKKSSVLDAFVFSVMGSEFIVPC